MINGPAAAQCANCGKRPQPRLSRPASIPTLCTARAAFPNALKQIFGAKYDTVLLNFQCNSVLLSILLMFNALFNLEKCAPNFLQNNVNDHFLCVCVCDAVGYDEPCYLVGNLCNIVHFI